MERLAIATAPGNDALRTAIDAAQRQLAGEGTLARLEEKWLKP